MSSLHKVADQTWWLRLGPTKTDAFGDEDGAPRSKPIVGVSAEALERRLAVSGVKEEPDIKRIWGRRLGPALSNAAIAEIVKRRVALA